MCGKGRIGLGIYWNLRPIKGMRKVDGRWKGPYETGVRITSNWEMTRRERKEIRWGGKMRRRLQN